MKKRTKILFFINPKSGRTKLDVILHIIEETFTPDLYQYEILLQRKHEKIEDAIRRTLKRNFDIVSAIGGDGTISSVAHSVSGTNILLSIVPTGTANVIAKELDIPQDIQGALNLIKDKHAVRKIDGIEVNKNYYFLRVSVGLSSLTIRNIDRRTKRILGSLAYLWKGIINYFSYNHRYFTVIIDGKKRRFKASDIVITNVGKFFISGLNMDPNIVPDDGILDVFVFKPLSLKAIIKLLFGLVLQRKVKELRHFAEAKEITISTKKRMPVHADGDIIGYTPITVRIKPGVLKVIVRK